MLTSPTATSTPALAALLLATLLAGCATQAPLVDRDWDAHRSALSALENWRFSGRIAIKTAETADSARLRWRQTGDDLQMTLSGPVGIKQASLSRENGALILTRDGERQVLDPLDDPLAQQFGWSLPLDYLPWWLRGLPAPQGSQDRRTLSAGRLSVLEQDGWTIEYEAYQAVDGLQLPRKIRFHRASVAGKVLLKDWVLEQ